MKSRNYLLILVSLTITGMPALAVDYVACREMLRTKNEMREMSVNYENRAIENNSRVKEVIINIPETECTLEKINYAGEISKCMEDYRNKVRNTEDYRNKVRKAQEVKEIKPYFREKIGKTDIVFYTMEGYKWWKALIKVDNDMRKAGCPY